VRFESPIARGVPLIEAVVESKANPAGIDPPISATRSARPPPLKTNPSRAPVGFESIKIAVVDVTDKGVVFVLLA
jgi:hypothetical protein